MSFRCALLLSATMVLSALAALAQKKEIKQVPAPYTPPTSGKEMYVAYCASCHGKEGKGDGPAASALKAPATDLTTLAKQNNGKFPILHVSAVISGEHMTTVHGSREMPVWGNVFLAMHGHDSRWVQMRVSNLTHYIESLQVK
ncbi:MAG: c-type cytochrome [Acidobacteriales bacterium]|nr:c-type cytochrome [Candidatus Koribacter versatilis]MBI3644542.1 c-type cytochrome [Terriglobales bacterium]